MISVSEKRTRSFFFLPAPAKALGHEVLLSTNTGGLGAGSDGGSGIISPSKCFRGKGGVGGLNRVNVGDSGTESYSNDCIGV